MTEHYLLKTQEHRFSEKSMLSKSKQYNSFSSFSHSGSAFEDVKVGEPNEFDFLLILDYKDKSHYIKSESGYGNLNLSETYRDASQYRLKLSLENPASDTPVLVRYFLDRHLPVRRHVDADVIAKSVIKELKNSNLSDTEKKVIVQDVVWLVGCIVRFGQWEVDTSSTNVICLSGIRHAYWFRVWCKAYLERIRSDAKLRNMVSRISWIDLAMILNII